MQTTTFQITHQLEKLYVQRALSNYELSSVAEVCFDYFHHFLWFPDIDFS